MSKAIECECSEEYGPCEDHSELMVSREGASLRTADELQSQFIHDAVSLGAELSPYGKDVLSRADAAMTVEGPMSNWLPDDEEGYALRDDLGTVANQVETELYTLGYSTYWDDGFRVLKITGGPLAEDEA
jgi:hypothetical protein